MKKGNYYILKKRTTPSQVDGYLFDRGSYHFGVRREGKSWVVTELSTGCWACRADTRKAAMGKVDRAMLKRIDSTFKSNWGERLAAYQEIISEANRQ